MSDERRKALIHFQNTDDAWGAELRRIFGKRAGNIRYTLAGKGKPGSELHKLYLARDAARIAWDTACGRDERGLPLTKVEG